MPGDAIAGVRVGVSGFIQQADIDVNHRRLRRPARCFVPVRLTDRQREEGRNSRSVEELERRYGVKAFPTVIFADADGTERARMEGYGGREEFRRVMESIR